MSRAADIAPTLQAALDDWAKARPALEERARRLDAGDARAENFDPRAALSPLPRAYQWLDCTSYPSHMERMSGRTPPDWFAREPTMYQGCSDGFLAPTADVPTGSEEWGIDFEAEVAVVTDFVPYGTVDADAAKHIVLVMIVNDVSLRALQGIELPRGFGFIHSKPASAFAPVAVTPDELGSAWRDARLFGAMRCHVNGELFGDPDAGAEMRHNFARLIAHAAKTRTLAAGSIIGAGTVSVSSLDHGFATVAERRAVEQKQHGSPRTPFLRFGDRVRIEMLDGAGRSIFGAIDHKIAKAG